MNAVEIEEVVSELASQPFDASDIDGGVLQRSNIHLAACPVGSVTAKLRESPATIKGKVSGSKSTLVE